MFQKISHPVDRPKTGMSANVIRDNKQSGANLWGIMGHTLSDRKLGHQEDPKDPQTMVK